MSAFAPPDVDAELIRLCLTEAANCRRFDALAEETANLRDPQPEHVTREFKDLVDRTWEARRAISDTPARTLAGVRAKAEALRADWTSGEFDEELAIADTRTGSWPP